MIVHMNLEAPFEFCGECPFKDLSKVEFFSELNVTEGYFYCDNFKHCSYAVSRYIESQNACERRVEE